MLRPQLLDKLSLLPAAAADLGYVVTAVDKTAELRHALANLRARALWQRCQLNEKGERWAEASEDLALLLPPPFGIATASPPAEVLGDAIEMSARVQLQPRRRARRRPPVGPRREGPAALRLSSAARAAGVATQVGDGGGAADGRPHARGLDRLRERAAAAGLARGAARRPPRRARPRRVSVLDRVFKIRLSRPRSMMRSISFPIHKAVQP